MDETKVLQLLLKIAHNQQKIIEKLAVEYPPSLESDKKTRRSYARLGACWCQSRRMGRT